MYVYLAGHGDGGAVEGSGAHGVGRVEVYGRVYGVQGKQTGRVMQEEQQAGGSTRRSTKGGLQRGRSRQ